MSNDLSAVDPSAVASVVTGVLNAMRFQQNSGTVDTPGGSGVCPAAVNNNSRNRKLVM